MNADENAERALRQGYEGVPDGRTYGECIITLRNDTPLVAAPFVVPAKGVGRRLVLEESIVRNMATAIGMVPVDIYNEAVDTRDADIDDQRRRIVELEEEVNGLRWAAEQYWNTKKEEVA